MLYHLSAWETGICLCSADNGRQTSLWSMKVGVACSTRDIGDLALDLHDCNLTTQRTMDGSFSACAADERVIRLLGFCNFLQIDSVLSLWANITSAVVLGNIFCSSVIKLLGQMHLLQQKSLCWWIECSISQRGEDTSLTNPGTWLELNQLLRGSMHAKRKIRLSFVAKFLVLEERNDTNTHLGL